MDIKGKTLKAMGVCGFYKPFRKGSGKVRTVTSVTTTLEQF